MSDAKLSFKQRVDLGKESSLLVWYPKIKELPIPQIKTVIVKTGHKVLYDWVSNNKPIPDSLWKELDDGIKQIGKFPVFMRTDQASMKHDWNETCYLKSIDGLKHHLSMLIEGHLMENMAGELGYEAIVFREFLELESYFTADYYGDFPVNKEVRCFIDKGKLVSMHNYWFEDAVKQGHPHDPRWRDKLKKLNALSIIDKETIRHYLTLVCDIFNENWSVDFAKGKNGTWYLIDCARGEVSYHPENIIVDHESKKTVIRRESP